MSKEGDLTMFQPSNALIISEYAPNLTRLKQIIAALDKVVKPGAILLRNDSSMRAMVSSAPSDALPPT